MKTTLFVCLLFLMTFLAVVDGHYLFRQHYGDLLPWQHLYVTEVVEHSRNERYRDFWTVRMIDSKQEAEVRNSANRRLDKWLSTLNPDINRRGSSFDHNPILSGFVAEIAEHRKKYPSLQEDDNNLLADKIALVLRNAQIIEARRKEPINR